MLRSQEALDNRFVVLVPAWNAERTLRRCLQSITRQDYEDLGVVVLNDASTDRTAALLADLLGVDGERQRRCRFDGRDVISVLRRRHQFAAGNAWRGAR